MSGLFTLPEKLPQPQEEELVELLSQSPHMRIERIISTGQTSPEGFWYDQEEEEFVSLLTGSAILAFADHTVQLNAGDYLIIPAHVKHRVEYTSKNPVCIWLCAFYSPQKGENGGREG